MFNYILPFSLTASQLGKSYFPYFEIIDLLNNVSWKGKIVEGKSWFKLRVLALLLSMLMPRHFTLSSRFPSVQLQVQYSHHYQIILSNHLKEKAFIRSSSWITNPGIHEQFSSCLILKSTKHWHLPWSVPQSSECGTASLRCTRKSLEIKPQKIRRPHWCWAWEHRNMGAGGRSFRGVIRRASPSRPQHWMCYIHT